METATRIMDVKAEYLDPDFTEEASRPGKRKSKIKTTKQSEPQLGKYSLSAQDFLDEHDELQQDENESMPNEVFEDTEKDSSVGDVGGEAGDLHITEQSFVGGEDDDIQDDMGDEDDQNETYTVGNDGMVHQKEEESESKDLKAISRQNKRIQDRQDLLNQRVAQLETHLHSLLPKLPTTKMMWPITDFQELTRLEEQLRTDKGFEQSFKQKLMSAGKKSLVSFINTNLKGLFYNTGRFTWTGGSAQNAKHGTKTFKAQGLRCVELLIECCEEVFGETADDIKKNIAERLLRINEGKHRLENSANVSRKRKATTSTPSTSGLLDKTMSENNTGPSGDQSSIGTPRRPLSNGPKSKSLSNGPPGSRQKNLPRSTGSPGGQPANIVLDNAPIGTPRLPLNNGPLIIPRQSIINGLPGSRQKNLPRSTGSPGGQPANIDNSPIGTPRYPLCNGPIMVPRQSISKGSTKIVIVPKESIQRVDPNRKIAVNKALIGVPASNSSNVSSELKPLPFNISSEVKIINIPSKNITVSYPSPQNLNNN